MASKGAKKAPQAEKSSAAKKVLFDDSASSSSSEDDQDDGGATLEINPEFARRFEHNKKREELERLQAKYGENGDKDDSESSTDESEDDEGLLVTEDLDAEISATLKAIKNKDPRIYDKEAVFYKPFDPATAAAADEKKEKPMFLRDYHRERYLKGDVGADEDEDADAPKTYAQEQADLKSTIVSAMHAAVDDEEWSDDDEFLKPAKKEAEAKPAENGMHPSRAAAIKLTEVDVAVADKDPETYLEKFMSSKAWAPPAGSKWEAFDSDDEDDDGVDIADEIEHAYNIRFEDPTKSNEILQTYSRKMADKKSVRKEELTGRKRLRQLEKEKKEAEKKKREEERARLRRLKIDEVSGRLAKIKEAAGIHGKDLDDEDWLKFLAEDYEDGKWEEEMTKRFGDNYYAEADDAASIGSLASDNEEDEEEDADADKKSKKKLKKPKWDDDIDIKDIIPDFEVEDVPNAALADADAAAAPSDDDEDNSDSDRPSKKKRKTTKDVKKDRIAAKREAKQELAKIEALVDAKMDIDNPRVLAEKKTSGFRYRETSPTSFGLTPRDILLAPSDAALNEFAGLKKLASFRDADKKRKDKKKLGKKARLRQWRRDQFGREFEESGPTFGFEKLVGGEDGGEPAFRGKGRPSGANAERPNKKRKAEDKKEAAPAVAVDGIVDGERKKKRKRSKGNKGGKEVEA